MAAPVTGNGAAPRVAAQTKTAASRFSSAATAKELCLRFVCRECQHWLSVPIRSLGMIDQCPGCRAAVTIPALDGYVVGLEEVLQARGARQAVALGCGCPTCEAIVPVASTDYGRPLHCGACGEWFVLQVRTADKASPAEPIPTPRKESPSRTRASAAGGQRVPPPATPPRPLPPEAPLPPSGGGERGARNGEPESFSGVETNYYRRSAAQRQTMGSLFGAMRIQRGAHWLSWALYVGGAVFLFSIGNALSFHGMLAAGVIWVLPVVGLNLSRLIVPFLIHSVACPRCEEIHECRGIWSCPCGYNDHREQHILQFRCPVCQGRLGRINCRRCEATILIW